MSNDESEKPVETTTPLAPEETNKEENPVEDTTPVASAETNDIDYKAELEAAQSQLKKAEYTAQELRKENKQLKKPEEVVDETINETTGYMTAEELTKALEQKFSKQLDSREQSLRAELARETAEDLIGSLSGNADEQALIKFHYENSVVKSGVSRKAILADLENARAIANKKKLAIENSELKEALKAKSAVGKASVGNNQDKQIPDDEPNLTPDERALIKRLAEKQGISMKEYIRRNKSRLTNSQ